MLTVEPLKTRNAFKVTRDGRFVALLIENQGWFVVRLGCLEEGPFETRDDALAVLND